MDKRGEFDAKMFARSWHEGFGLELETGIYSNIPFSQEMKPASKLIYKMMQGYASQHVSLEASAAQLEVMSVPCATPEAAVDDLVFALGSAQAVAQSLALQLRVMPVLPADMPRHITDMPYYQGFAAEFVDNVLLAVLRVCSFQVNIGCRDEEQLFRRYGRLREDIMTLRRAGDLSNGERARLYSLVVPDRDPPAFQSMDDVFRACQDRADLNPAKLHNDIVVKHGGVIEIRCFDATDDPAKMLELTKLVQKIAGD